MKIKLVYKMPEAVYEALLNAWYDSGKLGPRPDLESANEVCGRLDIPNGGEDLEVTLDTSSGELSCPKWY